MRWPLRARRAKKLSHYNALLRLREHGYSPDTIYDIGAYRAGWSGIARRVFPGASLILFEANADNLPCSRPPVIAISMPPSPTSMAKGRSFCRNRRCDRSIALSGEQFALPTENLVERKVLCARLDTIVKENSLPPAGLIKIDVQGAEIDVLAGATEAIDRCEAIIAELSFVQYNHNAPLMSDVISAIGHCGLRCVDICELHRNDAGGVLQADFLFVKPTLFDRYSMRIEMD